MLLLFLRPSTAATRASATASAAYLGHISPMPPAAALLQPGPILLLPPHVYTNPQVLTCLRATTCQQLRLYNKSLAPVGMKRGPYSLLQLDPKFITFTPDRRQSYSELLMETSCLSLISEVTATVDNATLTKTAIKKKRSHSPTATELKNNFSYKHPAKPLTIASLKLVPPAPMSPTTPSLQPS